MNAQIQKQIMLGGLAGLFIAALSWFLLGGKRDSLVDSLNKIDVLKKEVDKGNGLKANSEKFQNEAEALQRRIDELVKLMPSEDDRGEIPIRLKKIADTAGIDQISFLLETPVKKEYYTEHTVKFVFRAGFHSFGHFTSLVSGYDKIINLGDIHIKRIGNGKGIFPAEAICKITAFVYNPAAPEVPAAVGGKPGAPNKKNAGGREG